jgi:hypothetical protein
MINYKINNQLNHINKKQHDTNNNNTPRTTKINT